MLQALFIKSKKMKKPLFFTAGLMLLGGYSSVAQSRGAEQPNASLVGSSPTTNESYQVQSFVNEVPNLSLVSLSESRGGCPDTLLWEDFQDQQIPGTWINLDLDGNTDANGRPQDWYVDYDVQSTSPGDTNWVASSWFTPFSVANNWLILDQVTICDPNYVLKWESKPFEGPAYLDGYKVLLSPSGGSAPSDFTVELADFAEGDGAGNVGPGIEHTLYNGNNGLLMEWTAALGAYNGQTVRIAFRHESDDDNLIMIDNIFVGRDNAFDLAATNLYRGTEYPLTPKTQVRPVVPSGDVTNVSATAVSACTLNFEIVNSGLQVLLDQDETGGALAGGQTQSFTLTGGGFTPPSGVIEDYAVTITASNATLGETDPDLSNNTATDGFSVTDTVFAREAGNTTGALSIGGGSGGIEGKLCNKFELVNDDYVSSISAFRTTGSIGDTTSAEIFSDNAGTPNALIASSAIIYGNTTDPSLYTYPLQNGPVFLTAGTYYACINEGAPTSASIATTTEDYVPGTAHVFFNNTWGLSEDYSFFVAFVIRMNMANCEADAGTLTANQTPVCLDNGSADISATQGSAPNVPNGYQVLYVLTQGSGLLIVDANTTPDFTVTAAGDYTIHTLVYDPNTVNPATLPPGATGYDVNDMLIQGGGTICGSLDVTGAPIVVETCVVGVEEPLGSDALSVYPNPTNGIFTLEVSGVEADAQITVLDVAGRQVYTEGVVLNGAFRKEFNLGLASGAYLLQVQTADGNVLSRKLQID